MKTIEIFLTPLSGKRLIAKAIMDIPKVKTALINNTVVFVAGTTNAFIALEALKILGEESGFQVEGFSRGRVSPKTTSHNSPKEYADVIIRKGKWEKSLSVYDVNGILTEEDLIFKGANAVNLESHEAGVLVGNPTGGTVSQIKKLINKSGATLYIPVGVEKRINGNILELAKRINKQVSTGLKFYPAKGTVFTELDAFEQLYGVKAELMSSGGVNGYEGCCYFLCTGEDNKIDELEALCKEISNLQVVNF